MTQPDAGRALLPHSIPLERDILNAGLEWGRRFPQISPGDFFRDAHVRIAAAMEAAQRQGMPPEYLVVRQILRECEQLDEVGELYLNELARGGVRQSETGLAANLQQLANLARRRLYARLIVRYAENPSAVDPERFTRDVDALRIAGSVGIASSFRTAKELAEAAERVEWVVRGFLALGAVTELTGKAKLAGKPP